MTAFVSFFVCRPSGCRQGLASARGRDRSFPSARRRFPAVRMEASPPPRAESSAGEQLVRAAMMSDLGGVTRALDHGASPNFASAKGDSFMTALMWAASEGSDSVVNELLDSGLTREDINATNKNGYSAIVYAFENMPSLNPRPLPPPGFPGAGDSSLKNRKVPNQVPVRSGGTGHTGCAKLLLMNGADLSVTNRYGESLLHLAVRKGQEEWVDLLLQQGLSPNTKCSGYKHTPITLAAMEVC
jgi:ankyrin repeat protein